VRLAAPPVEGAANDALVAFVAEWLAVPRRAVHILSASATGASASPWTVCRRIGSARGYSVSFSVSMWNVNSQGYLYPGTSSMIRV
jgi:hypothetical protein